MNTRSALETRALRYLARREYSRLELERKLSVHAQATPGETLANVLDKLEQRGFLSAERVIEQIIHTRRPRYGNQYIVHELKEKGIDEHLISSILPTLKETEKGAAFAVWQKKFGTLPTNLKERGKQMRFMISRGFSSEIIRQLLSQTDKEDYEEI